MSRRYTDTAKRSDPWYRGLSPIARSVVDYLRDRCDRGGVWYPDYALAEREMGWEMDSQRRQGLAAAFPGEVNPDLGSEFVLNWNAIVETLNAPVKVPMTDSRRVIPQVMILESGHWWMPKFVRFTVGAKGIRIGWPRKGNAGKGDSSPHQNILMSMKAVGVLRLYEVFYPGSVSPLALAGQTEGDLRNNHLPVGPERRRRDIEKQIAEYQRLIAEEQKKTHRPNPNSFPVPTPEAIDAIRKMKGDMAELNLELREIPQTITP